MKILHIAPNAPYNDYWGYQENLLPKYHKKLGHDVCIITTNTAHENGKIVEINCSNYILNDGVKVLRLSKKQYKFNILTNLKSYLPVYNYIVEYKPDFIFFHGLISSTIFDAIKYKRKINPNCKIVQDNHMDYFNHVDKPLGCKQKIIRLYYRRMNAHSQKHIDRIYGVTPWRKIYAQDYFKIKEKKTDILIMGADDEKIDFEHKNEIRFKIRQQHNISDNDFLIVTGGKIDAKKKIDLLMKACSNIPNVKLLVFGSIAKELENEFSEILKSSYNIIYIGWINSDQVYNYFLSSDLVCFPGSHSVLWEQACACKIPCLFEHYIGMEHVNNGGNSELIHFDFVQNIRSYILDLIFSEKYYTMKSIASSEATDAFLYSKISEKALECMR